jgi:hypothetical protein
VDVRPFLEAVPPLPGLSAEAARRQHALDIGLALGAEFRGTRDPSRCLALEGDATRGVPPGAPFEGQARELSRTTLRQEYEVTASAPGWLCVTDTFYPGWRAEVDGAPAEIVPAFFAFRAVPVPAGTCRVVIQYEPESLRWGLVLSGVGVLALGVAAVRRRRAA